MTRRATPRTLREMQEASNSADRYYAALHDAPPLAQAEIAPKRAYAHHEKVPGELTELQEQIRVIQWWDANCADYGLPNFALFHIPNGGGRGMIESANLRRSGVRPGIEDLFLSVARKLSHGLFLEMKAKNGKVSDDQIKVGAFHYEFGYYAKVAYSHIQAIQIIKDYLE